MELAARMAERAQGLTSPNPPVGAIIVKNGIILSRGFTQPGGKPHAEIDAINKVKNKKNLKKRRYVCDSGALLSYWENKTVCR